MTTANGRRSDARSCWSRTRSDARNSSGVEGVSSVATAMMPEAAAESSAAARLLAASATVARISTTGAADGSEWVTHRVASETLLPEVLMQTLAMPAVCSAFAAWAEGPQNPIMIAAPGCCSSTGTTESCSVESITEMVRRREHTSAVVEGSKVVAATAAGELRR